MPEAFPSLISIVTIPARAFLNTYPETTQIVPLGI
jgi:hypothetical protein